MQPAPGPGLDAARDLLRAARRRPGRGHRRWARLHPAGGRADDRAVGAVPVAARRRCGCGAPGPARAPPSPRSRSGRQRSSPGQAGGRPAAAAAPPGGSRTWSREPSRPRPWGHTWCWCCSVAARSSSRSIRAGRAGRGAAHGWWPLLLPAAAAVGGLGALCWVALKVGALSFGGGFVIVPLMQHDAVHTYHWMSIGGVSQRRRARAGHSGTGRRDGGRAWATPRTGSAAARWRRRSRSRRRSCSCCCGGGPLRAPPRQRRARSFLAGAGPGGDRRDPRLGDPARRSAAGDVAVPGARRSRGRAAARAPRRRRDAAVRRAVGAIVALAGDPVPR